MSDDILYSLVKPASIAMYISITLNGDGRRLFQSEWGKRFIQKSRTHNSACTHKLVNEANNGMGNINVNNPPYIRAVVMGIRIKLIIGPDNGSVWK